MRGGDAVARQHYGMVTSMTTFRVTFEGHFSY